MRRAAMLLALVVAVLVPVGARAEHPAPARQPNVVLFFIDTLRAAEVHCLGYARDTTPSLDELASRGTLFETAISPSAWSLPCYASIFTSLPVPAHAVDDRCQFLDPSFTTLAQIFSLHGYRTGGFVGGGHLSHLFGMNKGFQTYHDQPHFGSLFHTVPAALKWLKEPDARPFFLLVQGYDAHRPYQPPLMFAEMYDPGYRGLVHDRNILHGEASRAVLTTSASQAATGPAEAATGEGGQGGNIPLTAADIEHIIAHYDAGITYADTWLGVFLENLQQLGLGDNSIVIVAGDHGEDLCEHGYLGHRFTLYEQAIHVPLVIRGPHLARGRRVRDLVELLDLGPTLLDLCGIPPEHSYQGRSLRPYLDPGSPPPDDPERVAFSAIIDALSARSRRWHLIRKNDGKAELYDLAADPTETKNVVAQYPAVKARLTSLLRDWDEKYRAAPRGNTAHLSDAEKAMFREMGYW